MVALAGAGSALWVRTFQHYSPRELLKDVRAGLAARDIQQPKARVETFLTARYGPLTEPANRQRAFLDLFNVDHTKALDFIAGHGPANQQQADTQAMAEWIAQYRKTMTAEERAALRARINSASGQKHAPTIYRPLYGPGGICPQNTTAGHDGTDGHPDLPLETVSNVTTISSVLRTWLLPSLCAGFLAPAPAALAAAAPLDQPGEAKTPPAGAPLDEKAAGAAAFRHVKVYAEPGRFGGWPANHGLWSWGNEILVGFSRGYYKDLGPERHNIDREPPEEHLLARSLDGGETWTIEDPAARGVLMPAGKMLHGIAPPGPDRKALARLPRRH